MSSTSLDIDDLYAWIDTIPLSRPKKNISRDFADGVLVAEVVHHFLPKYVELHNYPSASGVTQRRVNWQTLNRRVLVKIGVRISDDTIQQLIDAKAGIIEQVLMELRSKIESLQLSPSQYHRGKSQGPAPAPPRSRGASRTRMPSVARGGDDSPTDSPKPKRKNLVPEEYGGMSPVATDYNHNEEKTADGKSRTKIEVSASRDQRVIQGYVAPPPNKKSLSNLRPSTSRSLKSITSDRMEEPPAQIIYRGHKMVPLQLLDEKEREMKLLESTNRSLTLKIFRLETLVNIKDQRVEDLTHQLQSLRTMYERVTDKTLAAAGVKPIPARAEPVS